MSLRIPRRVLLVITFAAFNVSLTPLAGQNTQAATKPTWEYRVVTLEQSRCTSNDAMTATLNVHGRQGWELVGYQAWPPQAPTTAEGSIALRSAVPDGRNDLYPQLVGSYQGGISLKMPQAQAGSCQLVFKRQVVAATHP